MISGSNSWLWWPLGAGPGPVSHLEPPNPQSSQSSGCGPHRRLTPFRMLVQVDRSGQSTVIDSSILFSGGVELRSIAADRCMALSDCLFVCLLYVWLTYGAIHRNRLQATSSASQSRDFLGFTLMQHAFFALTFCLLVAHFTKILYLGWKGSLLGGSDRPDESDPPVSAGHCRMRRATRRSGLLVGVRRAFRARCDHLGLFGELHVGWDAQELSDLIGHKLILLDVGLFGCHLKWFLHVTSLPEVMRFVGHGGTWFPHPSKGCCYQMHSIPPVASFLEGTSSKSSGCSATFLPRSEK